MDEVPQASEPFEVILGIKSVSVSSGGFYKAMFFIKSDRLVCNPNQFCHNPDRIKGHILFFFFCQFRKELLHFSLFSIFYNKQIVFKNRIIARLLF